MSARFTFEQAKELARLGRELESTAMDRGAADSDAYGDAKRANDAAWAAFSDYVFGNAD